MARFPICESPLTTLHGGFYKFSWKPLQNGVVQTVHVGTVVVKMFMFQPI